MTEETASPADVVTFWCEAGYEKWFKKDEAFDRQIKERFAATHQAGAEGQLSEWSRTPDGALALILVLDQFSRNLFRDSAKAFAQDPIAAKLAADALDAGFDRQVDPELQMFFHMPFMHSEAIADQERCIALCHCHGGADALKYAHLHEQIIRRFGRFPHRNAVLGRHTTSAEQAFLDGGGFAG